ncbi:phenol hydroxylase subunit [Sphingobium sp. EM0848]|uniref:phenol hydroxylase subunit n=1 Tax=Sphingobium sp. EM0848 TaxID=2743473 RepID=UPI00159C8310|nr:phenol hydroxylase subunit [Sphingobium sp. EM0848]
MQAIVTGITAAQVIEFTFVYGDPDLAVELVLPLAAFCEFCSENGAHVAVPDDRLRASVKRLISPIAVAPFVSIDETEPHA